MSGICVIVCGGRTFGKVVAPKDPADVARAKGETALFVVTMDTIHAATLIRRVIQGGATGADGLARIWAGRNGIACVTYDARWSEGRGAGPRRNRRMLVEGEPDRVIAFPGGRGTADMVRQAKAAGIDVLEVQT